MSKVVIISASNGQNLELSQRFADTIKSHGKETQILDLVELDLPLYTPAAQKKGIPTKIEELKEIFNGCEKFVISVPEYNGGLPPTFTNLVAWISVSGDDWRSCFNGKSVAIASASGGGGQHALVALRVQLAYIGANVVGRQVISNFKAPAKDASIEAVCKILLS